MYDGVKARRTAQCEICLVQTSLSSEGEKVLGSNLAHLTSYRSRISSFPDAEMGA